MTRKAEQPETEKELDHGTIVTMPANKLTTEIHKVRQRMPAILAKDDQDNSP